MILPNMCVYIYGKISMFQNTTRYPSWSSCEYSRVSRGLLDTKTYQAMAHLQHSLSLQVLKDRQLKPRADHQLWDAALNRLPEVCWRKASGSWLLNVAVLVEINESKPVETLDHVEAIGPCVLKFMLQNFGSSETTSRGTSGSENQHTQAAQWYGNS